MSIKLMSRVWDEATSLDGSKLIVMLCLADHANDEGICQPSTQEIAHRCRVTKRHAIRILSGLEKAGFVSSRKRPGQVTIYALTPQGKTQ